MTLLRQVSASLSAHAHTNMYMYTNTHTHACTQSFHFTTLFTGMYYFRMTTGNLTRFPLISQWHKCQHRPITISFKRINFTSGPRLIGLAGGHEGQINAVFLLLFFKLLHEFPLHFQPCLKSSTSQLCELSFLLCSHLVDYTQDSSQKITFKDHPFLVPRKVKLTSALPFIQASPATTILSQLQVWKLISLCSHLQSLFNRDYSHFVLACSKTVLFVLP